MNGRNLSSHGSFLMSLSRAPDTSDRSSIQLLKNKLIQVLTSLLKHNSMEMLKMIHLPFLLWFVGYCNKCIQQCIPILLRKHASILTFSHSMPSITLNMNLISVTNSFSFFILIFIILYLFLKLSEILKRNPYGPLNN